MQQQQAMGEATAAAGQVCEQWLSRLRSMEQLLFSAQSVQFLDIRKPEAEAFRVSPAASPWSQNPCSFCMELQEQKVDQHLLTQHRLDGKATAPLSMPAITTGTSVGW